MNTKLFYAFKLIAYTGISACNGLNVNEMNQNTNSNVPSTPGLNTQATASGLSDTARNSETEDLRRECVNILNTIVMQQFGSELPKPYKDFLVENDPSRLENLGLVDPFYVISFKTPKSKQDVQAVANRIMQKYKSLAYSFPYQQEEKVKINKPWCIASHSEAHNYNDRDNDEDGARVRYYIDLKPDTHPKRPLKIYRVLRNNTVESIRIDNMNDFIGYCKKKSEGINKSIKDAEDYEKKLKEEAQ